MKNIVIVLIFIAACLCSCGNSSTTSTESKAPKIEKATDPTGIEFTSHYICPMACKGSGNANPGQCPACGMDYVHNQASH